MRSALIDRPWIAVPRDGYRGSEQRRAARRESFVGTKPLSRT